MNYFLQALKKYAVFSGRARRKEFWMFGLFQFLIGLFFMMFDYVLDTTITFGNGTLYSLFTLAMLIPSIAVGVRRMHDVGKSGWFMLIIFIPLVGVIWLLVLDCTEGTQGSNEYGPDPKAELAY